MMEGFGDVTNRIVGSRTMIRFGLRHFVGMMRELQINPTGMDGKGMSCLTLLCNRINHGGTFNVPSGTSVVILIVFTIIIIILFAIMIVIGFRVRGGSSCCCSCSVIIRIGVVLMSAILDWKFPSHFGGDGG